MAKENEFNEILQRSVEQDILIDSEIQKLEAELMDIEGQAIKTPEQAKRAKEIKAKIEKLKGQSEKGEKVEESSKTKNVEKEKQPEKFNVKNANYDQLLAKREEVKLTLEDAMASPIKDTKRLDELQKELANLEKAITALETAEIVSEIDQKETLEPDGATVEQQQKDEKNLNKTEKQENDSKEAELKKAYYDAMVKFYAIRETNANKLTTTPDSLVNTEQEYLREIKAEDAMYRARDEYLKLGKTDPYAAEREALNEQAKKCEKQNRDILAKKTQEYRSLEVELAKLQKARNEKEEDIAKAIQAGATPEILDELNNDLKELDYKIKNTKQDLAKVKENLSQAMDILEKRRNRRRELSLETREYSAQSSKEQANMRYAADKVAKSRTDFAEAGKLSTSSIKLEVERNQDRYDELRKQLKKLKETEPDNFEKRLALLEQLDDASQQLKVSKEVQKDVEQGIQPDTDEAIKQAEKNYKSKEEKKEEFVKDAEKLREVAEAQERTEGEITVEDPTGIKEELEKQQKEAVTMAVVGAMAMGGPEDSMEKDAVEAATIYTATAPDKESLPPEGAPCPIAELNNPNLYNQMDEKGSKEYIKTVEAIEAANKVEERAVENAEKS